jgi:hypothetical protein
LFFRHVWSIALVTPANVNPYINVPENRKIIQLYRLIKWIQGNQPSNNNLMQFLSDFNVNTEDVRCIALLLEEYELGQLRINENADRLLLYS